MLSFNEFLWHESIHANSWNCCDLTNFSDKKIREKFREITIVQPHWHLCCDLTNFLAEKNSRKTRKTREIPKGLALLSYKIMPIFLISWHAVKIHVLKLNPQFPVRFPCTPLLVPSRRIRTNFLAAWMACRDRSSLKRVRLKQQNRETGSREASWESRQWRPGVPSLLPRLLVDSRGQAARQSNTSDKER